MRSEDALAIKGHLVFLKLDGEITSACVDGPSKKGVLVNHRGTPRAVSPKEIIRVSERVCSNTDLVAALENAQKLAATLDIEAPWELLLEEEEGAVLLEDIAALIGDDTDDELLDALALRLAEPDAPFKMKDDEFVLLNQKQYDEKMEQLRRVQKRDEESTRTVSQLLQLKEGELTEDDLDPDVQAGLLAVKKMVLDDANNSMASRVLEKLFPGISSPSPEQAFRFLVEAGVWDINEDLNLLRLGARTDFPEEVLESLAEIRTRLEGRFEGRNRLENLVSVAIDDPDTTEVDDALAVEVHPGGTRVHVLICDVASAIAPGSPADEEAMRRASTIYHPVTRYPMLPTELGAELLTLAVGQDRLVIDHCLSFDSKGKLFDVSVAPAVCALTKRISYDEADEILENSTQDDPYQLRTLFELSESLWEDRRTRGALQFFPKEIKVQVNESKVSFKVIDTWAKSRRLVSEFMVTACTQTGQFLRERNIPTIYRVQDAPEDELNWTVENARNPSYIHATIRKLKRASVTMQPGRHAALGVDHYTQITSPLRRYGDLLMQRQILSALRTRVGFYSEGQLLERMAKSDTTSLEIRRCVSDAERYWTLVGLQEKVGETVRARVLSVERKQAIVLLEDYGVNTKFFPARSAMPDEDSNLELVLAQADPRGDRLVLKEE